MRLLILYSTIDGHTLEICERLAAIAREGGHEAADGRPDDAHQQKRQKPLSVQHHSATGRRHQHPHLHTKEKQRL